MRVSRLDTVQRLDSGVNRLDGLAYRPPLGLLRRGDPEHGWVHTPHTECTEMACNATSTRVPGRRLRTSAVSCTLT